MLKNFIFAALLLIMIAVYLSYKQINGNNSKLAKLMIGLGTGLFIIMLFLTINLYFAENPILLNTPPLIWFLLFISIVIEIISLYKKVIPGQFIAASILIFLVYPTLFSIGVYLLVIAIMELVMALIYFQKGQNLGL